LFVYRVITYSGVIIYLVAYDFYLIINAFINVFKYRKKDIPLLLSSKCIILTVAMISQFGNNELQFKKLMISYRGLEYV